MPCENFKADSSIEEALGFSPPQLFIHALTSGYSTHSFQCKVKINISTSPSLHWICAALTMQQQQLGAAGCHLHPSHPITSSVPTGHGWHHQSEGDKVGLFISPPPLCKCVTVRRDIVRRSVGSTKPWLCWPPYKNSRLSSFFLEVSVVCTHVSLLSIPPHQHELWPVQKHPVPA